MRHTRGASRSNGEAPLGRECHAGRPRARRPLVYRDGREAELISASPTSDVRAPARRPWSSAWLGWRPWGCRCRRRRWCSSGRRGRCLVAEWRGDPIFGCLIKGANPQKESEEPPCGQTRQGRGRSKLLEARRRRLWRWRRRLVQPLPHAPVPRARAATRGPASPAIPADCADSIRMTKLRRLRRSGRSDGAGADSSAKHGDNGPLARCLEEAHQSQRMPPPLAVTLPWDLTRPTYSRPQKQRNAGRRAKGTEGGVRSPRASTTRSAGWCCAALTPAASSATSPGDVRMADISTCGRHGARLLAGAPANCLQPVYRRHPSERCSGSTGAASTLRALPVRPSHGSAS